MSREGFPDGPDGYPDGDPTQYANYGAAPDDPTGIAPTPADEPTGLAPAAPTESAPELAWSRGDGPGEEPVPYTGADYGGADYGGANYGEPNYGAPPPDSRPTVRIEPGARAEVISAPWYRKPPLLFGIAALLAALTVGGLAIKLTSIDSTPTTTTRVTKPGQAPSNAPVPQTVTVTGSNGQPTVTTITPTTTAPATTTTTTTAPTTTTTTTSPTTTTTTTSPTTTTTATTTTTTTPTTTRTTTTTTTAAPTTSIEPPTTTAEPPTTSIAPPPTTTVEPLPPTTQAIIPDEPLPTVKPAPEE